MREEGGDGVVEEGGGARAGGLALAQVGGVGAAFCFVCPGGGEGGILVEGFGVDLAGVGGVVECHRVGVWMRGRGVPMWFYCCATMACMLLALSPSSVLRCIWIL